MEREGRRDRDPFSDRFFQDFFRSFDQELDRMRSMFNDLFQTALKDLDETKGQAPFRQPLVYGFTMKVGPDGRPRFEEFGNTKPWQADAVEGREPLTDVIEADDHVAVTMELPGVAKDDINLHVAKEHLTVRVETASRKYRKSVELPAPVKPETTEATYKNGILDITVKRAEGRSEEGHRVNIR